MNLYHLYVMVSGMFKSRTFRRVKKSTPGGRNVTHFERRKPSKAICGGCGATLKGVPREIPTKMMNLSKTQKRPERPFGGVLCSKCTREVIIMKAHEA